MASAVVATLLPAHPSAAVLAGLQIRGEHMAEQPRPGLSGRLAQLAITIAGCVIVASSCGDIGEQLELRAGQAPLTPNERRA